MLGALLVVAASTGAWAWWRTALYPAGARKVLGYAQGEPVRLVAVPVEQGKYMERRAARALKALMQAAAAAGHPLSVTRAFATHAEQARLYAAYLEGAGNLAARPGYSNHQRGLSVDFGGVGGFGTPAYAWLKANAPHYGFENDVPGEHWHWTYTRGLKA